MNKITEVNKSKICITVSKTYEQSKYHLKKCKANYYCGKGALHCEDETFDLKYVMDNKELFCKHCWKHIVKELSKANK